MDLTIEIKQDTEDFELYNPNWLYLRVLKFVADSKYDFSRMDLLPTLIIKVNKKDESVLDLERKIAELYDIPDESLVILLRHENIYNSSVRTELYNIDWRKEKKIDEASKLDHGTILYVEEGDPKQQFDTLLWNQEFKREEDKLVLNLNDPINDPNADVFNIKIEMKKHSTLLELKQRVSLEVGIPPNEFVLKRYNIPKEFKNLNSKLIELGLNTGALIKVERGTPHLDGVFDINISKVNLKSDSDLEEVEFDKKRLFKLTI